MTSVPSTPRSKESVPSTPRSKESLQSTPSTKELPQQKRDGECEICNEQDHDLKICFVCNRNVCFDPQGSGCVAVITHWWEKIVCRDCIDKVCSSCSETTLENCTRVCPLCCRRKICNGCCKCCSCQYIISFKTQHGIIELTNI